MFGEVFPTPDQIAFLKLPSGSMFWLYGLPQWVFFVGFFAWSGLCLVIGIKFSSVKNNDATEAGETITISAVLALLGLLLAFSISNSLNRLEAYKSTLTSEAEAASTLYTKLSLFDTPPANKSKELLVKYAQQRVSRIPVMWGSIVQYSESMNSILDSLSAALMQAVEMDSSVPKQISLISSTTNFFDAITSSRTAVTSRMQIATLASLLIVIACVLFIMGQYCGRDQNSNKWHLLLLVLILSILLTLMVDLDRPYAGFILVNESAVKALNSELVNHYVGEHF